MGILQRFATLSVVVSVATACTAQSTFLNKSLASNGSGVMPLGLTCPVMTKVDYNPPRSRTIVGASPDNPLICLIKRPVGAPERLILNWYTVERLRQSDVDSGIEVLSSLLTRPIGYTTSWYRFLGNNQFPYETRFAVAPDQSITVGEKVHGVRVITAKAPVYEDNEYWFDKESLLILKYIDHNTPSRSYTVTALTKIPAS